MSSLSDLPDEILNLISIRLNGFDNCSLWMASDSKLKQRLVNNVITDFDIKYTIPGRYLWPVNFLKKLQNLSRLSLVVDQEELFHLPLHDVELFPIPTLKYLELNFHNSRRIISSDPATSDIKYTHLDCFMHLKNLYCNLEHLFIYTPPFERRLPTVCLGYLPRKLRTFRAQTSFKLFGPDSIADLNNTIERLPRTLTLLDIHFDFELCGLAKPCLDLSKLPPNLTSLNINAPFDDQTYHMFPKSLKECSMTGKDFLELSPYLPTGLEKLSIEVHESSSAETMTHFKNLQSLHLLRNTARFDYFITNCPPKLKTLSCINLNLEAFADPRAPNRVFNDCLTELVLTNTVGVSANFISLLPQSLTALRLSKSGQLQSFPYFSLLPRNLKSFSTNLDIVENTSLLPDSLTSLFMYPSKSSDPSHFDRLPSQLETFTTTHMLPTSILKQLPQDLKSLVILSAEIFDDEIVRMLPRGLKDLAVEIPDQITDTGAAALPRSLERLMLFHNTSMTDAAVALLPRSLTYLKLFNNPNLTDECIKHLPRNLIVLLLNEATRITSKSCKDLPQYLRVLSLPKCKDWGKEISPPDTRLPQYLHLLNLGCEIATERWRATLIE